MTNVFSWSNFGQYSDHLLQVLKQDQIVVCDTDTVPGLLGNVTLGAFAALGAIKEREKKPYLLLVGSKEKLIHFVDTGELNKVKSIIDQCWPGPLTLIFKAKLGVPAFLLSPQGAIAVRIPHHPELLNLLTYFDALFSTSANKSGLPTPASVSDIDAAILALVPLVITQDKGEKASTVPSTILDCSGESIKVVREGAFPVGDLEKLMQVTFEKF